MTTEVPPRMARPTLLGEDVGRDHEEFAKKRGKVRMWRLGHHIGVFECSGVTHDEHAEFIIDYHKRFIEAFPRPFYSFANWTNLQGYSPDVRRMLTEWQIQMAYDELHVAHQSRLLAMSIAVANAVMPTVLQVHATEEQLDDALLVVRRKWGV